MREIELRAFSLKERKMYYQTDGLRVKLEPGGGISTLIHGGLGFSSEVTLFTGLLDIGRKKIFDGDILGKRTLATSNMVVKWDRDLARYCVHFRVYSQDKSKRMSLSPKIARTHAVIGNVYEHAILLRQ